MFRLIIADDEMDARDNMIACIDWAANGLEIVGTAGDGLSALNLILREQPDLVLIDIRMPGLSGIDVIKRIRENMEIPPAFIIVSGYDEFVYAQEAINLGVVCYLLKPFLPDDLLSATRKAIRNTQVLSDMQKHPLPALLRDAFDHSSSTACPIYPMDLERAVISCLLSENSDQIAVLANKFVDNIFQVNNSPIQAFDCFLILYAEICRTLMQRGLYLSEDPFPANDGQSDASSIENLVRRGLQTICAEAARLLGGMQSSSYIITRVLDHIHQEFQEKLSLEKLAAQVHVSPVYLSNLFSKTMGKTLVEYIQAVRIDHAKELLKNTHFPITDIAERVGYGDGKYFAQVFKKATGITPTAFRNQVTFSEKNKQEEG